MCAARPGLCSAGCRAQSSVHARQAVRQMNPAARSEIHRIDPTDVYSRRVKRALCDTHYADGETEALGSFSRFHSPWGAETRTYPPAVSSGLSINIFFNS